MLNKACTVHQGFFSFPFCPSCPSSKLAGSGYRVWIGPSQDSWPQVTTGIFHTTWCSAIKAQVKEEPGRTFTVIIFVFPNNCYTWQTLAFQETLNICPLMGSSKWISYFALPARSRCTHKQTWIWSSDYSNSLAEEIQNETKLNWTELLLRARKKTQVSQPTLSNIRKRSFVHSFCLI